MTRKYFVVFAQRADTRVRYWFDIFSRPGFRHVFVMWQPPAGVFKPIVSIEPLLTGITANFAFGILIEEAIARLFADDHVTVIVEVDVSLDSRVPYFLIGPRSCVNIIKSLLGVHAWRVQTPRQLFKHLVARGAHVWHRESADG